MTTRTLTDAMDLVELAQRQRKPRNQKKVKRAKPVKKSPKKALKKSSHPADQGHPEAVKGSKPGLITQGVRAAFASTHAAIGMGLGLWCVVLSVVSVAVFVSMSWQSAPVPTALSGIRFANGVSVPAALQQQWLRGYPAIAALRRDPSPHQLQLFAEHLAVQPAVADVNRVSLVWAGDATESARRLIEVDLQMRIAQLPVMLANGERAWVDGDGVVLAGSLPGPKGQPVVRGYGDAGLEAMQEVLSFWPLLRKRIEPGLVTEIHLDALLGSGDQRGIVLRTKPGTLLIWGAPGEARFGVEIDEKIANLVHTLDCQGDLASVRAINVRFAEPFAIARQ